MSATHEEITKELMDAFFRLHRLHKQQKSPVEGMKHSEIVILFRIKEHAGEHGAMITEISQHMRVTTPTVTQLVKKLEEEGYVKREQNIHDRRSIRISLTEKGEAIIQKAQEAFFARYSGLVDYLGKEKSMLLTGLLAESTSYFSRQHLI